MTVIPNQYFGLGDVVFTMTLVKRIADWRRIVWPVMPQFVEGLQRAYPDVEFVNFEKRIIDHDNRRHYEFTHPEYGECTVLPLRFAHEHTKQGYTGWMSSKYEMYGMDYNDWHESAKWCRDGLKELELTKILKEEAKSADVTNISDYILCNNTFGSDCAMKVDIRLPLKTVLQMSVKPGFSLFDYQPIIENASAIHTVNTSILYLIDLLDIKAKEVHVYPRSIKGQTHDGVKYLFNRHKYIWHE